MVSFWRAGHVPSKASSEAFRAGYIARTSGGGSVKRPIDTSPAPMPAVAPDAQEVHQVGGALFGTSAFIAGAAAAAPVVAGIAEEVGMGLPGGDYELSAIMPGGEPFRVPDLPDREIVKRWWTGTAEFAIDNTGQVWVAKKIRRRGLPDTYIWKKVTKRRATVIGKELNRKNLNKAMAVLKRYKNVPRVRKRGKTYSISL